MYTVDVLLPATRAPSTAAVTTRALSVLSRKGRDGLRFKRRKFPREIDASFFTVSLLLTTKDNRQRGDFTESRQLAYSLQQPQQVHVHDGRPIVIELARVHRPLEARLAQSLPTLAQLEHAHVVL